MAVSPAARGQRLGQRLMRAILARERDRPLRYLHATVTPDNSASRRMFDALARELGAPLRSVPHFDERTHFEGAHASEHLHIIGPIERRTTND